MSFAGSSVTFLVMFWLLGCSSLQINHTVKDVFLWKVSKGTNVSYLFGTIHQGVPIDDMPEELIQVLDHSDLVVTEVDLDEMEKFVAKDLDYPLEFYYSEDKLMTDYIGQTSFQRLANSIRSNPKFKNFSDEQLNGYTPYFFAAVLYSALVETQVHEVSFGKWQRRRPKFGLDYNLQKRARLMKKATGYLEKAGSKLRLRCTNEDALHTISAVLKQGKIITQPVGDAQDELEQAYRQGDAELVRKILDRSTDQYECLLSDRNQDWLFKIKSLIDSGERAFFAVGLAHMVPPTSVKDYSLVQLLQREGYTVLRVSLKK